MKRQTGTILLVEDDGNDQFLIERAFRKNGVTDPIHKVFNGAEAIQYLNGDGKYSDRDKFPFPSYIITDLKMPVSNGFDVLAHVKGNPLWSVIPIVVLSASSDSDDIQKAYLSGANCYLVKPANNQDLAGMLKKLQDFWNTVEVPEVDEKGLLMQTKSAGKLASKTSF